MTTKASVALLMAILASAAVAQELPTPTTPEQSATPSIWPTESITPSPTPEQTPSITPARSVRISFVPPPLEGRISLGIYDANGKLVRVLHQEAQLNQFEIGADALVTQWDGKDSQGTDLPPGKYRARGYMVGALKIEELNQTGTPPPEHNPSASVRVKLMPNPLEKDKRAIVELAVGFDSNASYLKTIDDLPLLRVSESPNLIRVLIMKKSDKSVDLWQDDGAGFHQFRVSNVDQMMAFDCGEFELK
jgi:FlgD Ig-like domain